MEQQQLRELRIKYSNLERDYEATLVNIDNERRISGTQSAQQVKHDQEDDYIDPVLRLQFEELFRDGRTSASKLHNLLFMRNTLDDDVTPCLRFGGNPLTSTKKIIDSLIANTCFFEEISAEELVKLQLRDTEIRLRQAEKAAQVEEVESPTPSMFKKTVLERFANAMTSASEAINPTTAGCSTCGKSDAYKARFKISDFGVDNAWYPICQNCADRLEAVCDFYQFIRNLRQGLYSTRNVKELYLEAMHLKRTMFYTRIGAKGLLSFSSSFHNAPVRINSALLSP